jgi:hypothetical protein
MTTWFIYKHSYKNLITIQKLLMVFAGFGIGLSLINLGSDEYDFILDFSWGEVLAASSVSFGVHYWLFEFFKKQVDGEDVGARDELSGYKANMMPVKSEAQSVLNDSVDTSEGVDVVANANRQSKLNTSSSQLAELIANEKWLLLERYSPKAANIFDELDEFGARYQAMFVNAAINNLQNQDLATIRDSVVSEVNNRFNLSEKCEINNSLKKVYKLYGDTAADEFIEIYNVIGDELDIEKLEADIKHKQQEPAFTKKESNNSSPPTEAKGAASSSVLKTLVDGAVGGIAYLVIIVTLIGLGVRQTTAKVFGLLRLIQSR